MKQIPRGQFVPVTSRNGMAYLILPAKAHPFIFPANPRSIAGEYTVRMLMLIITTHYRASHITCHMNTSFRRENPEDKFRLLCKTPLLLHMLGVDALCCRPYFPSVMSKGQFLRHLQSNNDSIFPAEDQSHSTPSAPEVHLFIPHYRRSVRC